MGSIVERKRKNGPPVFDAQIVIKRKGKIIHRESETFQRKPAAGAWIARREKELARPGALVITADPPIKEIIKRYIDESEKAIGKSKAQCLKTIQESDFGAMRSSHVGSQDIITYAQSLDVQPQTRGNYMSHLGSVFTVARPAWGYPLNRQAFDDAQVVLKKLGAVRRSKERRRRPSLDELDAILRYFGTTKKKDFRSPPMQKVIPFAIFSTRRQEEITRIRWDDLDAKESRIMVRDMKHPGEKEGNDIWCDLTPEALAIIQSMPRVDERIFPFTADTISASFTRACLVLGINIEEMSDDERLHFHDLRHDGVSRLFELGWTIPRAANVSAHRSWTSLKRYSHIRQVGDKYQNWKWLPIVLGAATPRSA